MSLISHKCIEHHDNRKVCTASENGKVYRLVNNSTFKVQKVKVDKCIAQKVGERRCDYLMTFNDGIFERAIFIELKGGDLNGALQQLHETVIYLKDEFQDCKIDARIVASKGLPNIKLTPNYKKLAKTIFPTKGTIEIGTNNIYTETI
jgi:hypothetical protein